MNDFDAAVAATLQPDNAQAARVGFATAIGTNPDEYAEARRVAQRTGVPVDTVLNLPQEMKRQDAVGSIDFDNLAKTSPATAALLADIESAKIAYDDTDNLTATETALGLLKNTGKALYSSVPNASAGLYGVARAGTETFIRPFTQLLAEARILPEDIGGRMADKFGQWQREQQAVAKANMPKAESVLGSGFYSGVQSLGQNLMTLPLAFLPGGQGAALAGMVTPVAGQAYGEARDKGVPVPGALAFGSSQAVIEYATEKLPLQRLIGDVKAGTPFFQTLIKNAALEVPGEQIATVLQDMNEWAVLNPEKPFKEYLAERPSAAAQTLIATLVGTGGQVTVVKGVDTVVQRFVGRTESAQRAEQDAQALTALHELATASKLRARDPGTFQAFVAQAMEDGPVQDVYINATTLAQSLADPSAIAALAQASPAVASQLEEALVAGGDIRIPVAEFASAIAGTDFAQALLPHLKTDPAGMSQAEAQQYMQTQAAELEAEVNKTLTEKAGDDVFKASREVVTAQIAEQLKTAGRFTDDVNKAYASLIGNFYAVMGAKLGIMPNEMAAQYPLQVRAERLPGAVSLDQGEMAGDQLNQTSGRGASALYTDLPLSAHPYSLRYALRNEIKRLRAEAWNSDDPSPENADERITGQQLFERIADRLNSEDEARAYLSALGVEMQETATLEQGARGNITLGEDITQTPSIITLLERADLSTFLHESGHFFLEVMADMASRPDAPAAVKADMDAVLAWFGVQDLATWEAMGIERKRPFHEQFARGFEAYLFEGKAPNVELQGLFQKFRAWLVNVYRSLVALDVQLNDEVRAVFDRMLASSDSIAEAEAVRGYAGLFETKPDFMTDEEWISYQSLGQESTQEAVHEMETRSLRDMQWLTNARSRVLGQLQREAREKRKAIRREVEAEVMAEPVNQARRFLKRGEMTGEDGEQIKVEAGNKLDLAAIREMYPETALNLPDWKKLGYGKYGMLADNGLHPDLVAEMFGFTSGDQLVRELLTAEDPRDKIEGITDQRMLERYGDLTDPDAISRAADEALHNDARLRFVATEVNALNKAVGARPTLARAAKQFAEATIARLKVRELKPSQYASASARAAKAADAAFKKGDVELAAVEKRNQLVNGYADRAAHAARAEVDKAVGYFNKFSREGVRQSLDVDYLDQIDALLARFDLRKGQSLKAIDKRKTLAEWADVQREMGIEPDVPADLLNEALRKSFKDMTVEEVRGLRDTVKQIEHLARLKHKLLTAKDQREFEAIRDDIAQSIEDNAGERTADTRTPTTNTGRRIQGLKRFWAAHIKAATWARIFDGGKDGGPVWEYFVRSANEAGDRETTMRADATKALTEILAPVFNSGKMGGKGLYFASIDRSLNREARIAIALNTGNASNLQRLLGGEGWTMQQLQLILDSLTIEEWRTVQAIWDHFESYRPMIAAKEKRVYGKEPEWLDAVPLTITRGEQTLELRGGYYPVKYDPAASQRAEEHADAEGARDQLRAAYTSATTRRSFTKARAEEVIGRPLLYSLAGLYQGVNEVIHDLSWHEWLIDVNRLLRSTKIDSVIRTHYGPQAKQQLKTWSEDIAKGDRGADNELDVALGKLRQNVSVAGLGYNVMSAAVQGLGFTQSIVRVGATYMGRGVVQYLANPRKATREVTEKSDFMANRSRTRYRELNELKNRVQADHDDVIRTHAYMLMMRAQQMVDVPTWLAAYEKAVGVGEQEDRAIALADQAVIDAQGGGQTKDQAAIERGGQAQKLFTVFYSFMNTSLNLGVAQTMTAKSKARLAVDYLLLYTVPPVLGFMLKNALTPGDSGDDDDLGELAMKLLAEQLGYLMGLMVVTREFGEAAKVVTGQQSFGYQGPAGVRLIGDMGKFGKQAMQGEFDDAFRKATVNIVGDLFGLPSAQINRTITGTQALVDGKTENPAAIAFGFQEKR